MTNKTNPNETNPPYRVYGEKGKQMKSYIFNFAAYDMNGNVTDYDYTTASDLWLRCDSLSEYLHMHTVELNETGNGSLILSAETDEPDHPLTWLEEIFLEHEFEKIADEYCGFELPERYLMGEPELNEIVSAIA